jgi:phospholipid/cholesterol/gamma-HCH transport system substrate-binding protein
VLFLVAVACSILATLFYLLAGPTLLQPKADFYLYLPDTSGLAEGSPVRLNGVPAGKVESIGFSGSRDPRTSIRIVMRLERAAVRGLPNDSYAQVNADTVIGDMYVNISSGQSSTSIRPGSTIKARVDDTPMQSLDLGQFEDSLRSVDALLRDIEGGKSRVGQFVLGESVYRDMRLRVNQLHQALRDATQTTGTIGQVLLTDRAYNDVLDSVRQFEAALTRFEAGEGNAAHFVRNPEQYDAWMKAVSDLRRSIAETRSREFLSSDVAYANLNRSLAGWIQKVDEFNATPMMTSTHVYENLNGAAIELGNTLRDFRENPKKYLRVKVF